jgi:hypothetical protein
MLNAIGSIGMVLTPLHLMDNHLEFFMVFVEIMENSLESLFDGKPGTSRSNEGKGGALPEVLVGFLHRQNMVVGSEPVKNGLQYGPLVFQRVT